MRLRILFCVLVTGIFPLDGLLAEDLFLQGGRFRVTASWQSPDGRGEGEGVPITADSGYFWFFSPVNVELVVKVVDACAPPFQRFWFFAAGLTDVRVEIAVEDVFAGQTRRYTNPGGSAFAPIQDTDAFATCGIERTCGQGSATEIAATPRADANLEAMALFLSPGITARQEIYDRLMADTGAIEALYPQLSGIEFIPRFAPDSLIVILTPAAAAMARSGSYHEWDCLNRWYGVESIQAFSIIDAAVLKFRGRFRTDRLIPDYMSVPGITSAGVDAITLVPIFPFDRLCVVAEGGTFHYFYHQPRGSPVITWHFTTAAPGAQPVLSHRLEGSWPQPLPDWLASFRDCLERTSAE